MIDAENVFNPKDFEKIQLQVTFSNITTRTEVTDTTKTSLLEIGDHKLVLGLPARSCNVKHSVMIEIKKLEKGKKNAAQLLNATGKILEAEEVPEGGGMRVTMECLQVDEQSWAALVALFSERQDAINKFLESVRGF